MTERITEFTRADLTFPVVDSGPIDGEIVVLLHGFPQTPTSWEATAEHLHAQGYRTVVPWQRGYARTASPERRRQYRSSELAADVAALLQRTGPAHLVGHTTGDRRPRGSPRPPTPSRCAPSPRSPCRTRSPSCAPSSARTRR